MIVFGSYPEFIFDSFCIKRYYIQYKVSLIYSIRDKTLNLIYGNRRCWILMEKRWLQQWDNYIQQIRFLH